ncbi:hypothetical protein BHE74_00009934 [Ensete ventricosum]|nr:hypothetical protein BHE74_00009934 [Ensete ventricosum]
MKCKKHPYELGAGVCASCLRERLLGLVAAQNGLSPHDYHYNNRRRRFDATPVPPAPPVAFPRSVSPYLPPRRSAGSSASHHRDRRFFSTPQLGPTFGGEADGGRSRSYGRFSVLKALFGLHRPEKVEADWGYCEGSGSRSWFSTLVPRIRRKEKQPHVSSAAGGEALPELTRRSCRVGGRGMSPDMEEEEVDEIGYSSESSNGWRRPTPTPLRRISANTRSRHHHPGGLGGVSSFAVCLSPLMRVGPSGRHSHVAEAAAVSSELWGPASSVRRHRLAPSAGAPRGLVPSRSRDESFGLDMSFPIMMGFDSSEINPNCFQGTANPSGDRKAADGSTSPTRDRQWRLRFSRDLRRTFSPATPIA